LLRWHLERFVGPEADSLVFVGPKGGRLRRSNFRDIWIKARGEAGLPDLHLHDLRHTGNTMAAATGASLRELMERMGHTSTRAATTRPEGQDCQGSALDWPVLEGYTMDSG
jgi:integrase